MPVNQVDDLAFCQSKQERRSDNPDFEPSLRLLIEEEKYSLYDVGLMFGRTRERVRQWCEDLEIMTAGPHQRGLCDCRVWNDDLNRFVPVKKSVLKKQALLAKRHSKEVESKELKEGRRARILEVAVELKRRLSRDPTIWEIAEGVVGQQYNRHANNGYLTSMWDGSSVVSTKIKYKALRTALRRVGVMPRAQGGAGHITPPRMRSGLYCKKGHLRAGNQNKRGACRMCRAEHEVIRRAKKAGMYPLT